ncbi:MAG: O-antigen ligase family protein [Anaerolineales bacterium]|nr:O-antigen ligase family protein [Anaerolineales bacterium]
MNSFFQDRLSRFFEVGARLFFAVTVVLIPFRWRLDIWTRPMFPLYSDYTDFLLFASDAAVLCMLVFWGCFLLLRPRKVTVGNGLMWVLLVGLVAAGWVSVFGSEDTIISQYHAVRFVFLLFLYLYFVNEVHSPHWVIVPVGLQVILQSIVAIRQSLSQSSVGLQLLGERLLDPIQSGVSIVPIHGERFLRAYGLSDHPNILGGCLAFGLILLLAVVLYGSKRWAWISSAVFLAGFLALLMTFSRSAWLGLMVAASFMVGLEAFARRWDSVKRVGLLGVASLLLVLPFLIQNFGVFESRINAGNMTQDDQMREREFLIRAGNTLFVEHSAIGIGLGASPIAMKNRFENFPLDYQPPHYAMLTAAMETGVVGGMFYLMLLFVPMLLFALRWRVYLERPYVMGAFALLLAMLVIGLFDYYTWLYTPGRLWQWLAWGMFSAAWKEAA